MNISKYVVNLFYLFFKLAVAVHALSLPLATRLSSSWFITC